MLSELCVRRPVFATMLVMSLVVLGAFSFRDLGVDLFPKADPAQVNVQLRLPGASPDEMTSSVIMPMENALSGIAGIDQMRANVNAGGSANIQIQFVLERDLEDAANAVREKVAGAMRSVPPETLPPVVQKQDPDADAIMSIMISSTSASLRTLTEIADKQVMRALESVDGVGAVTMSGDRSREIHIVVDVEKLNAHGLSIEQVVNAIRQENVEIPGGTLEQGKWEVGLRTLGRVEATDQFNEVIVATVNGVPLRVSDIGYAEDSVKKVATSLFMADGRPGVQLDIRRASGENTIKVIEGVKQRLDTVRKTLPPDVTVAITTDDSEFIYASIASLEEHLIWGSLLASLVVLFFIRNLRAVIIASVAIPASIVATFTLMRAMDFTLNNMTLLALTLAVGIVIDDAIVVLENIFRYIEEKGRSPFDAAIEGTREVALPVMATTLSLIVIFLPVAFMTGYARRFIYPFGLTMAFSILVSMIVSFTLTPMLSSRWLTTLHTGAASEDTKHHRLFRALDRWYSASLRWTLAHPMWIIGISAALVALTLPLNRMVGRTFVPAEDMNEFTVHADTPQGTSIEGTAEIARNLVKEIGQLEGVSQLAYIAGADRYTHFHLLFYLEPSNERTVTQAEIMTEVRRVLARHPAYAASIVGRNPLGGGGNFGLQASLLGPDLATLYEVLAADCREGQADPEPRRREIRLQRRQPGGAGGRGSVARGRPRCAHGNDRQHAPAHGGRRRRDHDVSRSRRAVPGDSSRAGEPAPRHRHGGQAHRHLDIGPASPDRQHRATRAGIRAHSYQPLEPAVFDQPECRHRSRPCAQRLVQRSPSHHQRGQAAAGLQLPDARADAEPRRDHGQPDTWRWRWQASSSTWCSPPSSRASCSRWSS